MNVDHGLLRRIPSLDGLRAASILLVLLGHLSGTKNFPHIFDVFEIFANVGVRIFFLISGYLITKLLITEREKTGSISLASFYFRRALRILPAAYVYIIIIAAMNWGVLSIKEVFSAFAYTSNYIHNDWLLGHLWSLSVEEQFYIIWPIVFLMSIRYFSMKVARFVALGFVFSAPVIHLVFWYFGWDNQGHYLATVGDSIATGCLLAFYWPTLARFDRYLLSYSCVILVLMLICLLPLLGAVHGIMSAFYNSVGLTILHASIAIHIYHVIERRYQILNSRFIIFFGVLSYSLYLWQQPFLNRGSSAWWTIFPLNLAFAILAALVSHYGVERPFLRLRSMLAKKWRLS